MCSATLLLLTLQLWKVLSFTRPIHWSLPLQLVVHHGCKDVPMGITLATMGSSYGNGKEERHMGRGIAVRNQSRELAARASWRQGSATLCRLARRAISMAACARRLVVVVGCGASGAFAAVTAARAGCRVLLLEATAKPLAKVLASGGGRCNVMHDPLQPLTHFLPSYPRG